MTTPPTPTSVASQLQLLITRYENLELTSSPTYKNLKAMTNDPKWLAKTAATLTKVDDGERIFSVAKEISKAKNDQRIDEMFAEFETADNMVNTSFYGKYDKLRYLPRDNFNRQPDLLGIRGDQITPVEVKLLSPNDLNESKFFQKVLDKINDHALPQLVAYHENHPFDQSFIFVRSHLPVKLESIQYGDLKKWLESKVERPTFAVTIITLLYYKGMWDFHL